MFKKRKGMRMPYNAQGLIHFTCVNYAIMPSHIQNQVKVLCHIVGKDYEDILFKLLTTENSVRQIATDYYVSESTLYELRKQFYEEFFKRYINKERTS